MVSGFSFFHNSPINKIVGHWAKRLTMSKHDQAHET